MLPEYLSIIKLHYPDIKSDQIQVFDDGWDHTIVVVNQQTAFRFPHPHYVSKLPIEVSFLKQFAPHSPVSVPRMELHQDKTTQIKYATYQFIPGVQFDQKVINQFSSQNTLKLAAQLGQFLTALHSFPLAKAKHIGIPQIKPDYWAHRFKKIQHQVFPFLQKHEVTWITKLFENFIMVRQRQRIKLVVSHGDICSAHIIVDPHHHALSGIIDFGDISIGDPAYDLQFEIGFGSEFFNTVSAHYTLPRDSMFDIRRQFYEHSVPARDLDNALDRGHKPDILKYKKKLSDFITKQPHLGGVVL